MLSVHRHSISALRSYAQSLRVQLRQLSSGSSPQPKIAIVGSGPAAFYAAQHLLKQHSQLTVDLYEKLPVPFGLVRYGVAPDHADVKNVVETFTRVASEQRLQFIGNVSVGQDVTLGELCANYTAVLLAYGAATPRRLGIEGESELRNVITAKDFVSWYNGHPDHVRLQPDLSAQAAVVIGNGNVALDVARILLSDIDRLKSTDIPQYVLHALSQSAVRTVHLIGRRGLLQTAFTIKEYRDLTKMPNLSISFSKEPVELRSSAETWLPQLPRPRRRLADLVLRSTAAAAAAADSSSDAAAKKQLILHFLMSPSRFIGNSEGCVSAVECTLNEYASLQQSLDPNAKPQAAAAAPARIDCGLCVVSVGYQAAAIDASLPIDAERGCVHNHNGKVTNLANVYCAGWIRTGATGVILDTLSSSRDTAQLMLADLADGSLQQQAAAATPGGAQQVLQLLQSRGVSVTSFDDWRRIDSAELATGKLMGKVREKILTVRHFLLAARAQLHQPGDSKG